MDKSCSNCHDKLIRHDFYDHGDEYTREITIESDTVECISSHEDQDEVWYICKPCQRYHLQCPKCLEFCRLRGFPAEKKPEGDIYHYVNVDGKFELQPLELDFDELYPKGYIPVPKELSLYHLDVSEWYPTGADGSRFSRWECESCEYKVRRFD